MRKQIVLGISCLLATTLMFGCGETTKTPTQKTETPTVPSEHEDGNLLTNGKLESFRESIRTDAEIPVSELGTQWATEYGLGTYVLNGETVAKVTQIDGDPCMKLDGRGGSSNIWIWAGETEADSYMYHPLGASPAGNYIIECDLMYDTFNMNEPTLDALATEFLGAAAQSIIQFTEYDEYLALPASTTRGEGWKHATFNLSKMSAKDHNGWFNLYYIPGERGGVLYVDNVTVKYDDPNYNWSYLVDINDGDKGQFSSYYKYMLTNDAAASAGYYTIGTDDGKGKVVIDGEVCAMKLSYEGHSAQSSFAKNVDLSSLKGLVAKVEFDAKIQNCGDLDLVFGFANNEAESSRVQVKDADGTESTVAGFKHYSYELPVGPSEFTRIQFSLNTQKDLSHIFEVTNLSIKAAE